jgi:uncharacterized OB-fold protein
MELRTPPDELITIRPDKWTEPFWAAASEHRLICARCSRCETYRMPPGPFCPRCRSQEIEWQELCGRGTVFTYTVVHHPVLPALRDHLPYAVAAVRLPDAGGVRLLGNVVGIDSEDLTVGLDVYIDWADIRPGVTVPRFRAQKSDGG